MTLHTITHPRQVFYLALKPSNTNGDVFVSSSTDGILRLFDIRRSITGICYYLLTWFDNDVCVDRFIFI